MKRTYLLFAFFYLFLAIPIGVAGNGNCGDDYAPIGSSETRKILESNGKSLAPKGYIVNRGLEEAESNLGEVFFTSLSELNGKQTLVEYGAGSRGILCDYIDLFPDGATAYGLDMKLPEVLDARMDGFVKKGKLKTITGKMIEETQGLPVADIGFDIMGPAFYTEDLTKVIQIYVDQMRRAKESKLFIAAQFPIGYKKRNGMPVRNGSTYIITKNREVISMADWMKTIPGLDVAVTVGPQKFSPTQQSVLITKTQEKIRVPKLELMGLKYDTLPPMRIFREPGASLDPNQLTLATSFGERIPMSDDRLSEVVDLMRSKVSK